MLGISDMADMSCQETGGQPPGMPAAGMQAAEHKEAIAVQEVSFPEFKYTPIVYAKEQIGEEKKKLLDHNTGCISQAWQYGLQCKGYTFP